MNKSNFKYLVLCAIFSLVSCSNKIIDPAGITVGPYSFNENGTYEFNTETSDADGSDISVGTYKIVNDSILVKPDLWGYARKNTKVEESKCSDSQLQFKFQDFEYDDTSNFRYDWSALAIQALTCDSESIMLWGNEVDSMGVFQEKEGILTIDTQGRCLVALRVINSKNQRMTFEVELNQNNSCYVIESYFTAFNLNGINVEEWLYDQEIFIIKKAGSNHYSMESPSGKIKYPK